MNAEVARTANKALLEMISEFAERKNVTNSQITLAWVHAQKPWIVPVPGTTKLHPLTENTGAAAVKLTADELIEMESASAQIEIVGKQNTKALEKAAGL
jgi:aryl-alcohol dehydrogenase-like predicted oxidoreductase